MRGSASTTTAVSRQGAVRGGQFLTFILAGEEYGLEVLKVREIVGRVPMTRLAGTPEFVRGVVSLRGKVIPVMDLRHRFDAPGESASGSCIIVVQVRRAQLGVLVDGVSDVVTIADEEIEPTPNLGAGVNTAYLLGLAKTEGRLRLLVDIERTLTPADTDALDPAPAVVGAAATA
jgi:purine-binding chemotaxis protein CheW